MMLFESQIILDSSLGGVGGHQSENFQHADEAVQPQLDHLVERFMYGGRKRLALYGLIWVCRDDKVRIRTLEEELISIRAAPNMEASQRPSSNLSLQAVNAILSVLEPQVSLDTDDTILLLYMLDEVQRPLQQMYPYKSPGPDEFLHFHRAPPSFNATHIVLIPKCDQSEMLIKHWGKEGHISLKLDISNAYDRVEWFFLESALGILGFHEKFVSLIMSCVSTVSFSFMLNGSNFVFLRPKRGLRQGDPLSPYLFLICVEKSTVDFSKNLDTDTCEELGRVLGVLVVDKHEKYLGVPTTSSKTMVSLENSVDRLEESVSWYFPNFDLFAAKANPHFSCAWLSMLETHDLIVEGSRWSVGSGLSVRILDDCWLLSPKTFRIMNSFVRWRGGATVRALALFPWSALSLFQGGADDWLRLMHKQLGRYHFELFPIICWLIWEARNKLFSEGSSTTTARLVLYARRLIQVVQGAASSSFLLLLCEFEGCFSFGSSLC
ncbi:hypothetical protein Sango_2674400 [Sesamum angolense]|uniref:Reverse transcriptase domain-containing protein n=1 Tax=Sesamum angolense TaxID=2727404 RepID=A0AAE2BHC3_9LAMI|nr:hypothetical protein Sango_2674400 [Sesamum angolense]